MTETSERSGDAAGASRGNWGRWGAEDERGALNLVDPAATLRGAAACRTGRVYPLGLPISRRRTPAAFDRPAPERVTLMSPADEAEFARLGAPGGVGSSEDLLVLPSHIGTHIDALSHVYSEHRIWNGFPSSSFTPRRGAGRCGIEKSSCYAGRGVLLDVAGHEGVALLEPGRPVSGSDLEAVAAGEGVELEPGDTLLVRTGWTEALARRQALPADRQPGLARSAAEFIADHDVAVVGADNAAVEVLPFDGSFLALHVELLVHRGVMLIEHLWLADLAADACHTFMIVVAALPVVGATGSPVNPVAVG